MKELKKRIEELKNLNKEEKGLKEKERLEMDLFQDRIKVLDKL